MTPEDIKKQQTLSPGPWKVEHTFGQMIIRDSEDYPVAVIHGEDMIKESKANADLIASAPELYKEMEGLQQQVETLQRLLQEERISHNKVNNFLTDKIAVLRKALEDIQFFSDPMGGTSNMGIYNIALNALKK